MCRSHTGSAEVRVAVRVSAGPLADIPTDRCVAIADGRAIVVRVGDRVVAFANRCLHKASPLAGGRVISGRLTCPLHFWRYHLPEGEHVGGQGALSSYPVTTVDGEVLVDVPEPEVPSSIRKQLLAHAREWDRDAGQPDTRSGQ
ncbi:hypothetical protein BH23ACT10_BH23ACT10_07190 [soil metagenome]